MRYHTNSCRRLYLSAINFAVAACLTESGLTAPLGSLWAAEAPQGGGQAQQSARPGSTQYVPPVRVSRTFFEAPINGSIRYQPGADAQPVAYTFESPVSWQEYPPTAPAPQAGYIADFRDFQGCARFNQSDDAALCFNIMPDVSSVSLTRESLTTQGIQTVVNRYLHDQATRGCEQSVQTLNFERANKSGDSFTVRYIAQLDSQGTCASDQAAIEITLTKE